MKILRIGGKNLASLEEEFLIDFNSEPLKSAAIFAISGSTGSGKSTILDALCLALYDKTPRISQAGENIAIEDIPGQTLNQGDPRSVLRRGTAEGYAMATFVALTGESYRSEWRVRRAHGKSTGALQNTTMALLNLTLNREEQGTKTELLEKIKELTGLTFEQFTRSVLLAQGDFATFLKAKHSEKADLLEKLTGTEIYSKISQEIYNSFKGAEFQKKLVEEKIGILRLLTPQERDSLINDSSRVSTELKLVNAKIVVEENLKNWYKQITHLKESLEKAELVSKEVTEEFTVAKPRYLFMESYDELQQIRDLYTNMERSSQERRAKEKTLTEVIEEEKKIQEELTNSNKQIESSDEKLLKLNKEYALLEPAIEGAIKTESVIDERERSLTQLQGQHKNYVSSLVDLEKQFTAKEESKKIEAKKIESCTKWFERYNGFTTAHQKSSHLLSTIKHYIEVEKGANSSKESVDNGNITLEKGIKRRDELKKIGEELERTLPTEVVKLREGLSPNSPCPVCGSTIHPFSSSTTVAMLEEQELNFRKMKSAKELQKVEEEISTTKERIVRANESLQIYLGQLKESEATVDSILNGTNIEWKELVAKGVLIEKLERLFGYWEKYEQELKEATQQEKILADSLIQLKERIKEQKGEVKNREKEIEEIGREINLLKEKIASLLNRKSVKEVKEQHIVAKESLEKELKKKRSEHQNLSNSYTSLITKRKAISEEIEVLVTKQRLAMEQIESWSSESDRGYTLDKIWEVLSKEHSFIREEKRYLQGLLQRVETAKTTLKERQEQLRHYGELNPSPTQLIDLKELQKKLELLLESRDSLQKEVTAIEVKLKANEIEVTKSKELGKELQEKELIAEEWDKLNYLFGSASGGKFKEIAQSYTLEILLGYANLHLKELTPRYKLERTGSSLGLQVCDLDMLGEVRSVHSLSGGESFLISLALALGLASLSSNRMNVESLFIDEGFGSLDMETLRVAIDALETLRSSGRKIGVISHVWEMTERIGVQIKVVKSSNGKSKIEIVSG